MAEDQLDDTFEDIFGDDALDDDSLNMDNIDNINNSTNSNSKTNPVEDVETLRKEIKMYSDELSSRNWLLIANKIDIEGAKDNLEVLKIRFPNLEIIPVSALSGEGIDQLKTRLKDLIGKEIY